MRRPSGFSLLELMVALLFMGLLLAGMARVYLAGLAGWIRVNEDLAAQRALRWAMERIREDLLMAGHLFPPPEGRALDPGAFGPAPPGAFTLTPGPAGDGLGLVMDGPLPVRAELGAAIPGPGPEGAPAVDAPVLVRPAAALAVQAGDLLLVQGERFEFARVDLPAELPPGRDGPLRVVRADRAGGAAFAFPHPAGALVQVVRPLRQVRYAVVPLARAVGRKALHGSGQEPCLVRYETAYGAARGAPELVAENVACFQVDYSPDRTFPGVRGGDPAATARNLDARLRALGIDPAIRSSDPFWCRTVGGLVRVRLEIRSPAARGDPAGGAASPRHRVRGQTLVVAPRNFGL